MRIRTPVALVAAVAIGAFVAPSTVQANTLGRITYEYSGCGCTGTRSGIAATYAWDVPSGQLALESVFIQNKVAPFSGFQVGVLYNNNVYADCSDSKPEAGFYEYVISNNYTCHELGQEGVDNNGYAAARSDTCGTCWEAFNDGSLIANSDENLNYATLNEVTAGGEIDTGVTGGLEFLGDFGDSQYGSQDHAWAVTFGSCCNFTWSTVGSGHIVSYPGTDWYYTIPPSPFEVVWSP